MLKTEPNSSEACCTIICRTLMDQSEAFNARELSDVKIVFSTSSLGSDGSPDTKRQRIDAAADLAGSGSSYFVHGVLLANASPVFKARLINWTKDGSKDEDGRKLLVEHVEEGELQAAEQLLRFMYSGMLARHLKPPPAAAAAAPPASRIHSGAQAVPTVAAAVETWPQLKQVLQLYRLANLFEVTAMHRRPPWSEAQASGRGYD